MEVNRRELGPNILDMSFTAKDPVLDDQRVFEYGTVDGDVHKCGAWNGVPALDCWKCSARIYVDSLIQAAKRSTHETARAR